MSKTLLVMAAGMGSRFGGLKQIEPMGPNGEFLIDYSVYDALKTGFDKVVFIIKKENYDLFKETIGKRVDSHVKVEYVFQTNDNIPLEYQELLKTREKPLGTAHAILCAKDHIQEPFAVINADDFYGREAYIISSHYLDTIKENHYGVVGYQVAHTLSPNGSAKRGVCKSKDGKLEAIIESSVERKNSKIIAMPLDGTDAFEVDEKAMVSMNLLLFTPSLFPYLEEKLEEFLKKHKEDFTSCEFLIPDVLEMAIQEKRAEVDLLETDAVWHGVTYKEDKEEVVGAIQDLVEEGVYNNPLWS